MLLTELLLLIMLAGLPGRFQQQRRPELDLGQVKKQLSRGVWEKSSDSWADLRQSCRADEKWTL